MLQGFSNPLWSTQIGGTLNETNNENPPASICIDGNNNLHIGGITRSAASFPLDNGGGLPVYYQPAISGIADGSITRFNLTPVQFVGVKENYISNSNLLIYPNPTSSNLNVQLKDEMESSSYFIYDGQGKLIRTGKLINQMAEIPVSTLSNGLYLLEISNSKNKTTAKFIKND